MGMPMQWLIDIILENIGPVDRFVDRGEPTDWDFELPDLTNDNAWHDLDLSGIVPLETTLVLFDISIQSPQVGNKLQLKRGDFGNNFNRSGAFIQSVSRLNEQNLLCAYSPTDGMLYRLSVGIWTRVEITVIGYWLPSNIAAL